MILKVKVVYCVVVLVFVGMVGMSVVGLMLLVVVVKCQVLQGILVNLDDVFVELCNVVCCNDVLCSWELVDSFFDYLIQFYVQYFCIKLQLFDVSGYVCIDVLEDEICLFLQCYKGEVIVDWLCNDWLFVFGKKCDWVMFDVEYFNFVLKDDMQVECYVLFLCVMKGQNVVVDVCNMLLDFKGYGEGCVDLIGYLVQFKQFICVDVVFVVWFLLEQNFVMQVLCIVVVLFDGDCVDNDMLVNVMCMVCNDFLQVMVYLLV